MQNKRILIVSLLLLSATWLSAQPPHSFTRYGRENNFSGTTVEDMAQDRFGQLWLATWGGLYSFDGRNFQNYRTDLPEDRDNPRSNHFTDVEILDNGDILVVSFDNRLFRLDPAARGLNPVEPEGLRIQTMFRPSEGSIFFLTTDGVVLDAGLSAYCRIGAEATVHAMVTGPDGRDWILTDRGIFRDGQLTSEIPTFCATVADEALYIGSSGELLRYQDQQLTSLPVQIDADITFVVRVPERQELLLGTDHDGFELYHLDDGARLHIPLPGNASGEGAFRGVTDRMGNLWIYSPQGSLYWYDRDSHRLIPFQNTNQQQGWNSETGITALLSDRQGNLWIGSTWGGLERVIFYRGHFKLRSPLQPFPTRGWRRA